MEVSLIEILIEQTKNSIENLQIRYVRSFTGLESIYCCLTVKLRRQVYAVYNQLLDTRKSK